MLCVKHVVDEKAQQSFIGVCKNVKEFPSSGFIIVDGELRIKHFTRSVGELFSITPYQLQDPENPVKLTTLMPQVVTEKLPEVTSRGGFKFQQEIGPRPYEIALSGDSLSIAGQTLYIFKIRFAEVEFESHIPFEEDEVPEENPYGTDSPIAGCPFAGSGMPPPPSHTRRQSVGLSKLQEEEEGEAMPMSFSPESSKDNLSAHPSASVSMANGGRRLSIQSMRFPIKRASINADGNDSDARSDVASLPDSMQGSDAGQQIRKTKLKKAPRGFRSGDSDGGSVSSRGSKMSQSSSYVKRIINLKNEHSNTRLKWLHYSFIFCLLVLIGLAIQENIVYRQLYLGIQDALTDIVVHADLTYRMAKIADAARSIDLVRSNNEWWNGNSTALDSVAAAKKSILDDTTYFVQNQYQFAMHGAQPSIQIVREDGALSEALVPMEAILATITSARYIQAAPLNDPNLPSQIQVVLNNAPTTILNLLNSTIDEHLFQYNHMTTFMPATTILKAAIGPVVCLVVILALIKPLYIRMEETRHQFLRMFYDIPKEVVKGIYEAHYNRLVSNEDEDEEEDITARFAIDKMLGSQAGGLNATAVTVPDSNGTIPHTSTDTYRRHHHSENRSKDPLSQLVNSFQQMRTDQHKVALKALAIFLISSLFFFTSGTLTYVFLQASSNIGTSIFWSAQRPILLRETTYLLREQYIQVAARSMTPTPAETPLTPVSSYTLGQYPLIPRLLDTLSWVQKGIIYGDSAVQLRPLTMEGEANSNLQLETLNA
ncbi:hypothetical protein HDV05_008594, partial [Chytridiales sp. JEL 0842]